MKPTITNAFTVGSTFGGAAPAQRKSRRIGQTSGSHGAGGAPGALGVTLVPMQADLRAADFGYSLELSPIQAIDAVHALLRECPAGAQFLVSVEQSAWRNGDTEARLGEIVRRLDIPVIDQFSPDQLVLSAESLASLIAIALPTRLLVIAVEGLVETPDAKAMGGAIDGGRSPLTAELRALAALEVLGDRSVVLHTRERLMPLHMIAQNFRHYLAAILGKPVEAFAPPEVGQIELLMGISGALTVRPIETQVAASSIDIGVNTSLGRFNQPASMTLIYDRPSNSWHAE